ncbi:BREX-3 system phosphatase PglZ [bacterium]|nr:BREX-3 system phosphatase PglZ [bacterium]
MGDFVTSILKKVLSLPTELIFINDIDNIFTYSEVLNRLNELSYKVSNYICPIAFRIEYELEIKPFLIRYPGSKYIVRCSSSPYLLEDIAEHSDIMKISFNDLYPNLNNECLHDLPVIYLDELLDITRTYFEHKNKEQTLNFLLEKIYLIDLSSLNSKEAFIGRILNIHSREIEFNPATKNLLREYANKYLPIEEDLFSKRIFNIWLKKMWDDYVLNQDDKIDFHHSQLTEQLRLYFINHNIEPCKVDKARWEEIDLREGVYYDHEEQKRSDVDNILKRLDLALNDPISEINWSEMIRSVSMAYNNILDYRSISDKQYLTIEEKFNHKFQDYLDSYFTGLSSKSSVKKPYTVSQILNFMQFQSNNDAKQALIIIDGLNYWQWYIIETLLKKEAKYEISTDVCFSWIPSITSLSRQAIFKGAKPDIEYNQNPKNEEKNWNNFWLSQGIPGSDIKYFKFEFQTKIEDFFFGNSKFLAFVTNDIDDIMHSALQGNNDLYNSTLSWLENSLFMKLLAKLKNDGYLIYVGSDHGNIEATGWRKLKGYEKFGTSKSRSRRHLEYANRSLLNKFLDQNPELSSSMGTEDNLAYLKNKLAFESEGKKIVTHGGSHFWEVLTPFIRIK